MTSLIVGLLPLAIIITLRDAFVLYTTAIHPKTAIDVLGVATLLILYPVSRTKYFQAAAVVWLSLFSFFLLLESLALTDQPLKQLAVIPYQILLLLIGSMLLDLRRLILLTIVNLVVLAWILFGLGSYQTPLFDTAFNLTTNNGLSFIMLLIFVRHRDLMEQDRQAELEASREQWRSLVESAPDLILRVTRDGTIEFANKPTYLPDASDGNLSIYDLTPAKQHTLVTDAFSSAFADIEATGYEAAMLTRSGFHAWYAIRLNPIEQTPPVHSAILIATDITQRKRLAQELHDGLGHHLTVLNVQLQAATELLRQAPGEIEGVLETCRVQAQEALSELRKNVNIVRRASLEGQAFHEAIHELAITFAKRTNVTIHFECEGKRYKLHPAVAMTLYRGAQEGLTNARKHAPQLTEIIVTLDYRPESVALQIKNDGVGSLASADRSGGFGLSSLKEQAEVLGGIVRARPDKSGNFLLTIRIPTTTG